MEIVTIHYFLSNSNELLFKINNSVMSTNYFLKEKMLTSYFSEKRIRER